MKVVLAEKPSVARELAVVPGGLRAPGGLLRGEGLPGHLGAGASGDAQGAAGLRPGAQAMVAGGAAVRPRAVRDQADRGGPGAEATRGGPAALPRRRRADLRHRRRPRGRADLPIYPGAGRRHGQAGAAALAQLADRVGDPRRVPTSAAALRLRRPLRRGAEPQRGGLDRRPQRDPLLHRPPPRQRRPLERRPRADARPGDDRPPRRRDPPLQARAVLGAADQVPRGHLQVRRRPLRQGRGRPRAARARAGPAVHDPGRRAEAGAGRRRRSCTT